MNVWITLSGHSGASYISALRLRGYIPHHDPLLQATSLKTDLAARSTTLLEGTPLIVTSGHALHALAHLHLCATLRHHPLITIGWHTPRLAEEYGFRKILKAGDRAADIPGALAGFDIAPGTPLLYLRGKDVAFPLKETLTKLGFPLEEVTVYETSATPPSAETRNLWREGQIRGILVFSPKAAAALKDFFLQEGAEHTAKTTLFYLGEETMFTLDTFEWQKKQSIATLL